MGYNLKKKRKPTKKRFLLLCLFLGVLGFFVGPKVFNLPFAGLVGVPKKEGFFLQETSWEALTPNLSPQMAEASAAQALPAVLRSCSALSKKDPLSPIGGNPSFGLGADWQPFCAAVYDASTRTDVAEVNVYLLFKEYLQPFKVKRENPLAVALGVPKLFAKETGLFTGYYAPLLEGSLVKTDVYTTPLYGPPTDVVSAQLQDFFPERERKLLRGRLEGQTFKPYPTRAEIDQSGVPAPVLLWLKNPVDLFFLQIQGSGTVRLPNGQAAYIGYGGGNGQPYTAIGKYMVEKGYLKLEEVSLQSIRNWLEEHPEKQTEVLHQNKSYVFFKQAADGPYGTQQVLLTPGRSLAVDRAYIPLGVPVFVQTKHSVSGNPFAQFMVTQDTGGAIVGPIRGDIYFGDDPTAELSAGKQNEKGILFVLLPKGISVTP